MLKAMDAVRPVKCGILPLPTLGVHRPVKEKLKREIKLPPWMHRQLEQNQVPGVYGGQSLGHTAMLEFAKREKLAERVIESQTLAMCRMLRNDLVERNADTEQTWDPGTGKDWMMRII